MANRNIVIRVIEAYLTADKIVNRKPKAEQILCAIERLGVKCAPNISLVEKKHD